MGKITKSKNTVTVFGLLFAIMLIFVAYVWRVETEINPVLVPYAKVLIEPGQQITQDMVGMKQIPPSMLQPGKVLKDKNDIINKYASSDTVIPKGSIFYERTVVEKEEIPASIILNYNQGHVLYNLPVTNTSSYGNSIFPGNYVDIYLEARAGADPVNPTSVRYEKLLKNVKVLAVKDELGTSVFSNLDSNKTAALIVFAVPEDMYKLLKKSEMLNGYTSKLIPVPTNEGEKDNPGSAEVASPTLKTWIEQQTIVINQ